MSLTILLSRPLLAAVVGALTQSAFVTVPYTENSSDRDSRRWRDQHQHRLTTIDD